jgi:hypothetical protein
MAAKSEELLTAGKIAQNLAASPAAVKKTITQLKIEPAAKKGACTYYSASVVPKIKAALK